MEIAEIKSELHHQIDAADAEQLKQLYGLITNYLQSEEEWETLTEAQKEHITIGLEQADAGLGNSLKTINERMKAKYGLAS